MSKRMVGLPEVPCYLGHAFDVCGGVGFCVQLRDRPSRRFDPLAWYQIMMRIGPDNAGSAFGLRALDCGPDDPAWIESRDSFLWMRRADAPVTAIGWPVRRAANERAVIDPVSATAISDDGSLGAYVGLASMQPAPKKRRRR